MTDKVQCLRLELMALASALRAMERAKPGEMLALAMRAEAAVKNPILADYRLRDYEDALQDIADGIPALFPDRDGIGAPAWETVAEAMQNIAKSALEIHDPELIPYDSSAEDAPPNAIYCVLFPRNDKDSRPAVLLNRVYGLIGTHKASRVRRWLGQVGTTSFQAGYIGGDRPEGWPKHEPLNAYWIDAAWATTDYWVEVARPMPTEPSQATQGECHG